MLVLAGRDVALGRRWTGEEIRLLESEVTGGGGGGGMSMSRRGGMAVSKARRVAAWCVVYGHRSSGQD